MDGLEARDSLESIMWLGAYYFQRLEVMNPLAVEGWDLEFIFNESRLEFVLSRYGNENAVV